MVRLRPPHLQIGFALKLQSLRSLQLQEALLRTMGTLDVEVVDRELAALVPKEALAHLARYGLRGELLFATETVLTEQPRLLGYYRLVLGYSQKDFYAGESKGGAGPFKGMESSGRIGKQVATRIDELATALCEAGVTLLAGLDGLDLSASFLADLSLITLGPQFRGGANNAVGSGGVMEVAEIIQGIIRHASPKVAGNLMTLTNAAGRSALLEFGADPDVTIKLALSPEEFENVLAIEIKAGTDGSNLYNRLGEAEKSHNTARANGFTECWTIVNVANFDPAVAHQKSPSTNRFYRLAELKDASTPTYADFRQRLLNRIGLT